MLGINHVHDLDLLSSVSELGIKFLFWLIISFAYVLASWILVSLTSKFKIISTELIGAELKCFISDSSVVINFKCCVLNATYCIGPCLFCLIHSLIYADV